MKTLGLFKILKQKYTGNKMASNINSLVEKMIDDMFLAYPSLFNGQQKNTYINALQLTVSKALRKEVELSTLEPDYERIYLQLAQDLSNDLVWKDTILSSTGSILLRWIASGIALNQFSIERAFQETFIGTASSQNSILEAVRQLGIRPTRKIPASVSVTLTRTNNQGILTIPKRSNFNITSVAFFNRDPIVFLDGQTTVAATLNQGKILETSITSNGEPFQKYEIGDGDSLIANDDIEVKVNEVEWIRTTSGPWTLGDSANSFYETTSSKSNIEIMFGNGDFGNIPVSGAVIDVTYVKTLGKDANNSATNLQVTWVDMPSEVYVTGVTSGIISGGGDAKSTEFYSVMGPHLRAANNRAVRRSDFRSKAVENYPEIKDALFRGQAELAPGRRSMMNVIGVTLLTDTVWSQSKFDKWAEDFNERYAIYKCEFLRLDPSFITMDISATIYCRPDATLEDVRNKLSIILQEYFSFKINSLGYPVYKTDISDILNGRNQKTPDELLEQQVNYVELGSTVQDVIVSPTQVVTLGNVNLTMQYTPRGGYTGRLDLLPLGTN
jgi:hypothetical protein